MPKNRMKINKFKRKVLQLICLFLVGIICTTELVNIYPPTATAQTPQVCAQITNPLTPDEERYARSAWQYFVNNYQENTGFVNSANGYPSGTLWDMGNYLMALNAARWLNFIPQEEFDGRLNKFLTTLGQLRLFEDSLPNKVYQAATGELVDYGNNPLEKGIGWSALDIGRIFAAFHVLRTCHPQYNEWLQSIIQAWGVERSIQDGQMFGAAVLPDGQTLLVQEGRLGYEEYAARGYELWDYQVPVSLSFEPFKFVKIYDIPIPVDTREYETTNANNYVVSESYILDGIEFGFEGEIADYAARVLEVQKRRYEQTGQLTAVSEDNINQAPYFLYNTVYSNGKNWATITENNEDYPQLRTISCKAVFGWNFLYPDNEYARTVYEQVKERCVTPDGVIAGIYEENNQLNDILTGNTNGLMMEILYYKARGNKPLIGYDSVSVSTGKPVGEDYTAPIFSNNQTETSPPPTNNQTSPPCTNTQTSTAMVIEPIEKVGDLGKLTCPIPIRKLTVAEKRHSEAAWQYFEANYEKNTGLVNDRADFKGVTLWGVGDYLAALHAAHSLEIITSEKFDQRIRKLLGALQRMFLFAGQLPHRGYDSQSLQPIDYGGNPTTEGTGWSGLDIARVMASLYNLKTCYPNYGKVVDEIVLQWSYAQLVREGIIFSAEVEKDDNGRFLTKLKPENRFGYEEYAARALQLWGFGVNKAAVSKEYQAKVIDKVTVPLYRENEQQNPYLVSNPFLHYGLEFGLDPQMRQLVEPIFEVQQKRYRETGILTGAATTLINRSPYIIHSAIAGWGKAWPTQSAVGESIPEERIVSTAVAFGFYALFPEAEYSRLLWESTSDLYNPNLGYYEGFYEKNGKREPSFSSTTNTIVLQSLLFRLTKNQPLIRPETNNNSLWWEKVKQGDLGRSLPEKVQQTARFMNNSPQGSYWVSDDNYVDLNIVGILSPNPIPLQKIDIPETSENNNLEDLSTNSTNKALFSPPIETISIEGINLQIDRRNWHNSNASNYLTNEPYLLWGLELGWSNEIKPQISNLLKVQENRFKNTQILTAVNEDSLDRQPYFLYYSIYADGELWSTLDVNRKSYPQLRFLSTKAAFAWHNLMPNNSYTKKLRNKVQNLADVNLGYFAGLYEDNKIGINKVLNINTNAIILESILYKARNNLPLALY
ncbi:MAG: DUF3131 domain-containing protein [Chloroflexi bacterium AL-N10]|nr:DUF3131 domain-containing protein [Chloroflexi bacterium AL-N10]